MRPWRFPGALGARWLAWWRGEAPVLGPPDETPLPMRVRLLLILAVVAFRLLYTVAAYTLLESDLGEDFYDEIALNLAQGRGFVIDPDTGPTLFRYPLYPFFLSLVFRVFGPSRLAVTRSEARGLV